MNNTVRKTDKDQNEIKTLIVYYSLSGNTKGIAQNIQKILGADIAEIEPLVPYAGSYDDIVEQGKDEVDNQIRPAIKSLESEVADYRRIIIGTPTWWYTMAPVVSTFLHSNKWEGKIVVPFMTNAGWPGTVIKDMKAACKGAIFSDEKEIRFHASDQRRMITSQKEVTEWIMRMK
jgi:flavodoxin